MVICLQVEAWILQYKERVPITKLQTGLWELVGSSLLAGGLVGSSLLAGELVESLLLAGELVGSSLLAGELVGF